MSLVVMAWRRNDDGRRFLGSIDVTRTGLGMALIGNRGGWAVKLGGCELRD